MFCLFVFLGFTDISHKHSIICYCQGHLLLHTNVHLVFESYLPLAKADGTFGDSQWKVERQNRLVIYKKFSEEIDCPKQISKCTGIPLSTLYRVVKNIRTGRGIGRHGGSGRPRKLNETDRMRLGQLVRFGTFRTLAHFRNKIKEEALLYPGKPFTIS